MIRLWNWCASQILKLWQWLISGHPQGIGTFLVGIAAIIALSQTSSVIKEVLLIQNQATSIESTVKELKTAVTTIEKQSLQVGQAIEILTEQVKEIKASKIIDSSKALKSPNATREEIESAIRIFTVDKSENGSPVYLPEKAFSATVDALQSTKSIETRTAILQSALKYEPGLKDRQTIKKSVFLAWPDEIDREFRARYIEVTKEGIDSTLRNATNTHSLVGSSRITLEQANLLKEEFPRLWIGSEYPEWWVPKPEKE